MIKTPLNRFFSLLFLLPALLLATPDVAISSDDRPKPVTNQLLKSLNLDRRYHKCIAVADGDTLTLEELGTVRFIGVDTPEKNHPELPVQFISKEASAFTKKLCLGKNIRLEYDGFDEDKRGNYGRILAYLYLEDGTFIQKQLLMKGYAAAYPKYPFDEKMKDHFQAWEQKARQEGVGIWKDRGMREVLWILEQRHLLIQVEKVSPDDYRLRIGNLSSRIIHKDDITLNLVQLYKAAHELAPGDLRRQLRKFGYKKTAPHEPPENTISIMGMAHKKWGIIYGNRVKPRVSAADLDLQIQELFKWVQNLDTELLDVTLSLNGYHPVSEKLIYTAVKPEIAGAFLESKQIEKNAGQTISWESAGKY
ncbi:MAG: thermonuclease family protein, partial [Deltaproteobacteria bacterium]|nr:thermonuclease family protein [Deltaproteobacteria bacterium]